MTDDIKALIEDLRYRVANPSAHDYGATDLMEQSATALERLSGRVRVKPLEWSETEIARGDGLHEHDGGYEAITSIGTYRIEMYFGSDSYGWEVTLATVGKVADCDDPDTAKAAAQADYESRILAALDPAPTPDADFQARVQPWMIECFGPEISADRLERGDRLLEEVLELLQSGRYPSERVAALTDYVWSREAGEPAQEVGGVMVTLAAYCLAHGLDMHTAGETELTRISAPEIVRKIRAKQAAKPTGSALPIPVVPTPDAREKALREAADIAGKYHDEAKRAILSLIRTTGGGDD